MQQSQPLTLADRLIPWYIVLFFVVLTGLLSYFAWLAVSSYTGVITDDAYNKGINYNKTLHQAEIEKALGWQADVAFTPEKDKQVLVAVALKDKQKNLIKGAKAEVFFQRPTQAGFDKKVFLKEGQDGLYSADVALPLVGIWDVYLSFTQEKNNFQLKKTYIVQP